MAETKSKAGGEEMHVLPYVLKGEEKQIFREKNEQMGRVKERRGDSSVGLPGLGSSPS